MHLLRPSLAALAVLAAALLSACSPAAPDAPTAVETPTVSASPEPPVPSPSESPLPTQARFPALSADGLGDLRVGLPVESDMAHWDPDFCRTLYPGSEWPDEQAGEWVVDLPGDDSGATTTPAVELFTDEDLVAVIVVNDETPRTAAGIGVGSSLEELRAAHPESSLLESGPVTDVWALEGERGALLFETAHDREVEGYWDPEQLETVTHVRVVSTASDSGASAASDAIGRCAL